MTVEEAQQLIRQGEFEEGTMLPKIEAAVRYLTAVPGGKVLITSLKEVKNAVNGKCGTYIHN